MIKLSQDKVLSLHNLITEVTGGDPALRDADLLSSALESAFQTFGGAELYPSTEEKAARIGFSLISNHAFVDGNKRIGMLVLLAFLELNGSPLELDDDGIVQTGLAVAAGKMTYGELLAWVRAHRRLP